MSATIYQSSASDNRGTVSFGVSGATDDRTPVDGIGYRIMFIDGEFPVGLVFDKVAFMPESGRVWLGWNDDNTWDQEPFLFRAVVTAVDRAGNESVPSNVVIVGHTGDTSWHKANPDPYTPITSGSTIAIRDEWKRAVRIEDVYRPSTLELIEKIESARIDPAVIIEEEKEIPEGRELSDDEVLQLQSILLDPANFARSPTMCEFIPAYTFAVTSKQDMRISFATNCNLIAIEIDEERREGVIFPLVSPMIQAFCEGLLTLPPLDSK